MSIFKQKLCCPVCKTWLGERFKDSIFVGHCQECRATFIWKIGAKIPDAVLDSDKDKKCGCKSCDR